MTIWWHARLNTLSLTFLFRTPSDKVLHCKFPRVMSSRQEYFRTGNFARIDPFWSHFFGRSHLTRWARGDVRYKMTKRKSDGGSGSRKSEIFRAPPRIEQIPFHCEHATPWAALFISLFHQFIHSGSHSCDAEFPCTVWVSERRSFQVTLGDFDKGREGRWLWGGATGVLALQR